VGRTDGSCASVTETTLDNGLRVLTDSRPDTRSVVLSIWLDRGARDEPAAMAGATHLLEHLLFRAGPHRSGAELARAVDAVGGDLDATTSREHVVFHVTVPASATEVALSCLAEVAMQAGFGHSDLEAERRVVLEELRASVDDHAETAHSALSEALFGHHALSREILGSQSTLDELTVACLEAHHAAMVHPERVVVAAAGRIDHLALCQWIDGHRVEGPAGSFERRQVPSERACARTESRRVTEQAHVEVGVRGLEHGHADRFVLAVADHLLGGGPSSRLFRDIREERGLAYDTWSTTETYTDAGVWACGAATAPHQAELVEGLLRDHLERLATDGPTSDEVADARGYLSGVTELALERNGARAMRLAAGALYLGGVPDLDEELAALARVRPADVQRVAATLLGSAGPAGPSASLVLPG